MQTQASQELLKIIAYSKEEAMRTGEYAISPDHLLLGMLRHADNDACRTLISLGVDLSEMKEAIEGAVFRPKSISYSESDRIVFSRQAENTLNLSIIEASIAASDMIIPTHLLLAITNSAGSAGLAYLKAIGIDHSTLRRKMTDEDLLRARKVSINNKQGQEQTVSILKIISSPDKITS